MTCCSSCRFLYNKHLPPHLIFHLIHFLLLNYIAFKNLFWFLSLPLSDLSIAFLDAVDLIKSGALGSFQVSRRFEVVICCLLLNCYVFELLLLLLDLSFYNCGDVWICWICEFKLKILMVWWSMWLCMKFSLILIYGAQEGFLLLNFTLFWLDFLCFATVALTCRFWVFQVQDFSWCGILIFIFEVVNFGFFHSSKLMHF